MKILYKYKGRSRLVKVSTLSVSNNAPYSVKFRVFGKCYECFTAETDFNKVILAFTQDFIDLRDWCTVESTVDRPTRSVLSSYYSTCGDFLNSYPVFPNPYPRVLRCIKKGKNVLDYFPEKLLLDISSGLDVVDVSEAFKER